MSKITEIKQTSNSFLVFKTGSEHFATHVGHVNHIMEVPRITDLPDSPEFVKGLINLWGKPLPVVDVRKKMGLKELDFNVNTCVVVVQVLIENEIRQLGLIVDSVDEVLEIDSENILPTPEAKVFDTSSFIYGVYPFEDEFILMLDIDLLFISDNINLDSKQLSDVEESLETTRI